MDGYDAGYWKHGENVTAGQFCSYIKTHIPPDAVLHVCGDNQVYLHFSPDGNAFSVEHDSLSVLLEYEGCKAEEFDTMEHIDIHYPSISIKNGNNFGKEHKRYRGLFIFVPEMRQIIHIAEGNGSNLSAEDIENGYVDYIYYDQYELGEDITETDGGQILLTEPLRDKFCCMAECIADVLDMAYGYMTGFIILN